MTTAEELRARYVEVLAQAEYDKDRELNVFPREMPPWAETSEKEREYFRTIAIPHLIEGLAKAGLMAVDVETQRTGRGMRTQSRYVTGWQEPSEPKSEEKETTR